MKITKETPLKEILELGKTCSQKNNCCKYGSGCLIGDDLRNIAGFLGISEEKLRKEYLEETERFNTRLLRPKLIRKNRPYGRCIFFDGNGCKIHEVKPLECRVGNCSKQGEALSKWFMLNYCVNANDPESIRQYAIYLKTNKTLKGGALEELVPKEKLEKILNFEVLR